ncbi:hypothetical protein VNO80_25443 [Phaseolus coccineus]|uniref:Uncharacterized protein n=1 Tax=Phaseolus coccineus TaxID=3886 RepID=A0AAN9LXV6_PHACN
MPRYSQLPGPRFPTNAPLSYTCDDSIKRLAFQERERKTKRSRERNKERVQACVGVCARSDRKQGNRALKPYY